MTQAGLVQERTVEDIFEGLKFSHEQEAEGAFMDAVLAGDLYTTSQQVWVLTYLGDRYGRDLSKDGVATDLRALIEQEVSLLSEQLQALENPEQDCDVIGADRAAPIGSGDLSKEYFLRVVDEEMDACSRVARLMGDRSEVFENSHSTRALVDNISLVL